MLHKTSGMTRVAGLKMNDNVKPRDIVKLDKAKIDIGKVEEIQRCMNCNYKEKCPLKKDKVAKLLVEARQEYAKQDKSGEYRPGDRGWEIEQERKIAFFTEGFIREKLPDRCSYELREIDNVIMQLTKRYDFADPKIVLMTRELLHIMLYAYRMDIMMALEGIKRVVEDVDIVNPLLKSRQEYGKLIVDTIEKMDKMAYGEKLSVDFTMSDLLKQLDSSMIDQEGVINIDK